ncbi:MAG: hypothetical protein IKR23_08195 [Lachnospiraceae bacterium]|nr:hypothetical protein [Lachnospiraceae bacterium]
MDIKKKVDEIVKKIKADPKLMKQFADDPVKTVESLAGVDIPDDIEDKIVAGVKAALASGKLGDVIETVKKLAK